MLFTMVTVYLPLVLTFTPVGASPRAYQLCNKYLELQPKADPRFACVVADILDRKATKYGTDPFLSLAIGMQESSLNPQAIGSTGDVGMWQFHPSTIRHRHIDRLRFRIDIAYQIEEHLKLLTDKMNRCSKRRRSWACYHSATPKLKAAYEKRVLRYYKRRSPS